MIYETFWVLGLIYLYSTILEMNVCLLRSIFVLENRLMSTELNHPFFVRNLSKIIDIFLRIRVQRGNDKILMIFFFKGFTTFTFNKIPIVLSMLSFFRGLPSVRCLSYMLFSLLQTAKVVKKISTRSSIIYITYHRLYLHYIQRCISY